MSVHRVARVFGVGGENFANPKNKLLKMLQSSLRPGGETVLMCSMRTFRLDSWWLEKRWLSERLTARVGQFAAQDFYGTQHDGLLSSSNRWATRSVTCSRTSNRLIPRQRAIEVRVVPVYNFYVKSMVEAEDRNPFAITQPV